MKLWSLNEENKISQYNMSQGPKQKRVLQLEGVLQLGGIRYITMLAVFTCHIYL